MTELARSAEDRKPGGKLIPFRRADADLPAVPGVTDVDVLEGEVIDGPVPPKTLPLRVIGVVASAATHERSRAGARHGVYVFLGVRVVFRRVWDSRTVSRYDRQIRRHEAAGNDEGILDWEARQAAFRRDRHTRRVHMVELPVKVFKELPKIAAGLAGAMAVLGVLLAVAFRRPSDVFAPFAVTAEIVGVTASVASAVWRPALFASPFVTVAALWFAGRKHASPPSWAQTSGADADITIDETTIAKALDALRIPQISGYLKQGFPLQYLTPCRVDGRGTHAVIRLPAGVPAEKIGRRRADLATGLYRLAKEVWPTTGAEAGIVDLWIADKGALNEGAGPYPLLESGFADVFKGLPFGKTLRGDPVKVPVVGRNTITGGIPEQGKSSAARVIACGYALDVTTEIRIYIPDTNFDFEVMKPRCSRYIMGAEDEHIEAIFGELEELKDELQVRGQLLVDHEVPEVTRHLANAGIGLHPMFVLLEEAHVAIQHKKYGKDISGLLCDIVKLDRKRGVHLDVSTQAPTKDSMPRDVTRNCSNGIAFAVGDHVANDALLGQGAYRGGHRATELIPGIDRGTALCKGFSGQRSDIVQVHFLSVARGNDQVTPLINRSLAELARRGTPIPGTAGRRELESRDLLDDLDEVLTSERVKLRDVVGLLRSLAPGWGRYQRMTATQLGRDLAGLKVRTVNTSGTPYLDPADLRDVLCARSTADLDGE